MIKLSFADKSKLLFNNLKNLRSIGSLTNYRGFTIVELLVVIVVIGILAAITIISYTGITSRAKLASVQSDLSSNVTQLKVYQTLNGSFPITLDINSCPATPVADTTHCLKISSDNELAYVPAIGTSPQDFRLTVSDATAATNYSTNANSLNCPLNFIIVPGSATYNTKDFCVMKYNAKQVGSSTTPISQAAGLPWTTISQTTAIANSPKVADCTGCHLLTEPEYMTIAQNVLNVASNWSGGAVGSGFIYSGHNDNNPANALAASSDDTDGYYGTGNSSSSGINQKRTLTLSNGEVIWDMSGNVYQWTNATIGTNQQPGLAGEASYAWKQWNNASLLMNGLNANSQPASTGVTGISGWSSTQGIGQLYSNYSDAGTRGFFRGGYWSGGSNDGILHLALYSSSSSTSASAGFRVSR